MAKKPKRIILGAFAFMILGALFTPAVSVYAEDLSNKPIHLQISPVKQKLKLEPGQSKVSSVKVRNIGTEKFTYRFRFRHIV